MLESNRSPTANKKISQKTKKETVRIHGLLSSWKNSSLYFYYFSSDNNSLLIIIFSGTANGINSSVGSDDAQNIVCSVFA